MLGFVSLTPTYRASPDKPTVDPKVTFHANVSKLLSFAKEI